MLIYSHTIPITRGNLPDGPRFEVDGAIWLAESCDPHPLTGIDWRWKPLNLKAFGKGNPDSELYDHLPVSLARIGLTKEGMDDA